MSNWAGDNDGPNAGAAGPDYHSDSGSETIDLEIHRARATSYRPPSPDSVEDSQPQTFPRIQNHRDLISPRPTNIIGAPLGRDLSALEAVNALVQQWERIYQENLVQHGEEAVQDIAEQVMQVRRDRDAIETIEDREYVEKSLSETEVFRNRVITERIEVLQNALRLSECEGEIVNIRAAIRCYRDGSIGPSDYFALIYAGNLVDFAPSYESFTHNRAERLDRYAAEHGTGWLWFEPPLDSSSSLASAGGINALKGTWAMETDNAFGMGEYSITMGFKRINDINYGKAKEAEDIKTKLKGSWEDDILAAVLSAKSKPKTKKTFQAHKKHKEMLGRAKKPRLKMFDLKPPAPAEERSTTQSKAVRLYYRMLLDTGATLPMLYKQDFAALGIKPAKYAASSTMRIVTANGSRQTSVYELHVSVCDTRTCQSLVDENEPVWPQAHPSLGGILPVAQIMGASGDQVPPSNGMSMDDRVISITEKAEGKGSLRLSGLLPLKTCYMQSTPGLGAVWLGEDRRDVLGAQRMPGQMRWEAGSTEVFDPGHPRMDWHQLEQDNGGNPTLQWALPPNQNGGPVRDDAVMEDGVSDSRRRPFPSFQMDGGSLHMPADPIPSTRQEQMSDAYRSLADVRCVPCAAVCCIAGMACTRGRVMPSD
ncbi:uncharacterized protein VDAG_06835 [Verticillium dahliae VdLs.17]|uniref:Uncharacterized protein n=1 Tax=Verticillium dahliae (strain VdLs.17 / ATCC MYA-4575 / FGSC 10137) TaxID=498257 RepID=G2X9K3_VERDV|nr:uncharacterized protein VDAG_06835 [Verticillium dahliae VdLs.17]EGY15671.1 hypothetical protein VDAG_06835 [Verticillium dahliae VdLs.17]KAH6697680.1 hypothetical protein EV126DRAFT_366209 [Verticillium dahliae]